MTGMVQERDELKAEIERLNLALLDANRATDKEREALEGVSELGRRFAFLAGEWATADPMSVDNLENAIRLLKIATSIEQAAQGLPLYPEPAEYLSQ